MEIDRICFKLDKPNARALIEGFENKIELWTKICNNGLFDIWEPIAPYNRFKQAKTDPKKFRIALIRISEIEEEFFESDISFVSDRNDSIKDKTKQHVTIKKPLIDDITFNKTKELLEETISDWLI